MGKTKVKRKVIYKVHRGKYTLKDVQRAMNIAIQMKKMSKGHLFSKTLKDRCVFCGRGMKTKAQCEYWALTFMDRTQTVLINPNYFTDKEIEALWLTHGEEYQEIKLPLNFTPHDKK